MPFSASTLSCLRLNWTSRGFARRSSRLILLTIVALVAATTPASAHVGSPDVYADGKAGPYRLFVTVRPPLVIPGVAEIEVRTEDAGAGAPTISGIQMAPIPLTGATSLHPPVADQIR